MVTWHFSFSAPVNPPDADIILTVPQVWKALQRKIRFAQEFVEVIESCEVIEDNGDVVSRKTKFKGQEEKVTERCVSYEPSWIDFHQEHGSIIRNTLSAGPGQKDGDDKDLVLTYSFQYNLPQFQTKNKEYEDWVQQRQKMVHMAVYGSIETARKMAREGKLN